MGHCTAHFSTALIGEFVKAFLAENGNSAKLGLRTTAMIYTRKQNIHFLGFS